MSGGSKEQTVGYKIYLGIHAILTHGPVDALLRLQWDARTGWTGNNTGGSITVNQPGLFGDEEREGGVAGTIDFEPGAPDQGRNAYLQGQLGTDIPAFRGVSGLVYRSFYWGMNPYLKKFSARLQRIHKTTDGAVQWYDEKAEIRPGVSGFDAPWLYKVLPYHSNPGYEQLDPPTDWDGEATLPYGNTKVWLWPTPSGWPTPGLSIVWIKKTLYNVPAGLTIQLRAENGCVLWVNGELIGASNRDNEDISANQNNPVNFVVPATGTYDIVGKAFTESTTATQGGNVLDVTLQNLPGGGDMNPAHIIREALTDPDWGLGYLAADIDDDAFMSAADALYDEGMGMSLLWDKQVPLEDFINEVLRHINAGLYVSRSTGKFVLKLIRADYDPDAIPTLGEDDIEHVTDYSFQAFGELTNAVTVNYWEGESNQPGSVTEQDAALVQMQGYVIATTIQYPGFSNRPLASRVALRDLLSLSTPLRTCTAYAKPSAAKDFNIGDVFWMDWPDFGEPVIMRVLGLALGDGKSNKVRLNLTQDIFGLPEDGSVSAPPTDTWTDPMTPASDLINRVVIEAPYRELVQRSDQATVDAKLKDSPETGYVLVSAERQGSSVNAQVWTDPGSGYEQATVTDFSPVVKLSAAVTPNSTAWTVSDVKDADLIEAGMVGQIGDELVVCVSKDGADLVVGRGVLDTVPAPHLADATLMFWDAYAGLDPKEYLEGETVDVKLLPQGSGGVLPLASATAASVTLARRATRPYPPGRVRIGGSAYPSTASGTFTVTWAHRNRVSQSDVVVDTEAASVTPADNIRYGLRFLDASDESLIIERQDIGPATADVTLNFTGDVIMELYTIDNYAESWQRHRHTFTYTPPGGTPVDTIAATAYTPVDEGTIIDGGDLDG